jgi:phenylalanyl-tRNA synthetase beta chain
MEVLMVSQLAQHWVIFVFIMRQVKGLKIAYTELPKFPEVRRDLALLIDKAVDFKTIKDIAEKSERKLLKQVDLFDVYEGDKLPQGKKSYAVSFILQDVEKTLTDVQIDKIMEQLLTRIKQGTGAELR